MDSDNRQTEAEGNVFSEPRLSLKGRVHFRKPVRLRQLELLQQNRIGWVV